MNENFKVAVVGIVGRTNGGKSTLVNQMVGEKISIVSPVVQTTRNTIRAILDERRGQLVLTDTPGLHKAESKLGTLINRMARQAASNVEILVLVMDASEPPQLEDDGWMRRILSDEEQRPCIFFLNKTDRSRLFIDQFRKLWLDIQAEVGKKREIVCFQGSAAAGDGVNNLVDELFKLAKPGERLYDPEIISDYPRRLAIADVIREKLFFSLKDELPHEVGVRIDDFNDSNPQKWHVGASLLVSRPSQKPIVIGPGGRTIRNIRLFAQKELTDQYGVKFDIELWVKVARDWTTNNNTLKQMGYIGEY